MFRRRRVPTTSRRQPSPSSILTIAVVAGAVTLAGTLVASSSGALAAVECHGQPATIVGTPNVRSLSGTDGDDVIVTGGARYVSAGKGNDLVCATGRTQWVDTEAGNDHVDTMGSSRRITIRLGDGADAFTGGRRNDSVIAGPGADQADTGGGDDFWAHEDTGDLAVLGEGNDSASASDSLPAGALNGGPGRNALNIYRCCGEDDPAPWVVDNVAQVATVAGEPLFHWENFRNFRFSSLGVKETLEFRGSEASERIWVSLDLGGWPAVERVDMGGGNDKVVLQGVRRLGPMDGGDGTDWIRLIDYQKPRSYRLRLEPGIRVDLEKDMLRREVSPSVSAIPGVENVEVDGFARVLMRGDDQANRLLVGRSCLVRLHGLGGPDVLGAHPRWTCPRWVDMQDTTRAAGGGGDDLIWGRRTNDRLLGGAGTDAVDGHRGVDTCEAEIAAHCERAP